MATPRILDKILSLDDFEAPARRCLPRPIFGFVVSGAERDASLRLNRAADWVTDRFRRTDEAEAG